MDFEVIPYSERRQRYGGLEGRHEAFLVRDNWDDYGFKTSFSLVYFDQEGERHDIGEVKILEIGMRSGYTTIDADFTRLGHDHASLGQDQSYYENLLQLEDETRVELLTALRDVVWNEAILEQVKDERAYDESLTRSVGETRFLKFVDTLHERSELTAFDFTYRLPESDQRIVIRVAPGSQPPTNIHVVIGRNGVGKTTLLTALSALLRNGRDRRRGRLAFGEDAEADPKDQIANLVTVAFSAFDSFEPPARQTGGSGRRREGTRSGINYAYVGLKKRLRPGDEGSIGNKSDSDLRRDFVESALQCLRSASRPRWQAAMRLLEADPLFAGLGLAQLPDLPADELEAGANDLFENASSGHKIVLLTLTRLVELVSERTLVLIDEPEAHLHPPLVMAFIRALSDLLARRNGIAILATHSPVVVQEVPASCVSLLFRAGGGVEVERPQSETFAENLGALTRDIFRVQVTESGHHAMIAREVADHETFDEVVQAFDGQLGAEGRALARAMLRAAG